MLLNLDKPLVPTDGVGSVEYVRRIRRYSCPLLFVRTYADAMQDYLEVDDEGKDKNGVLRVVNLHPEQMTTYWLTHWRSNHITVDTFKPDYEQNFRQILIKAITGPHYVVFEEGEGL